MDSSDLDIVVAGTSDAILMVEAGAKEVSEELVIQSIQKGHEAIKECVSLQSQLVEVAGKEKQTVPEQESHPELEEKITSFLGIKLKKIFNQVISKKLNHSYLSYKNE